MHGERHKADRRLNRVAAGDLAALGEVLDSYRPRLRRMIRLRLDRRLQGRVDPSDILQEAYLEISRRAVEQAGSQEIPFFLWLRMVTGQKLLEVHRRHLGTQLRDVAREVTLYAGVLPQASSASLASFLLASQSSACHAAQRTELQLQLQQVLNGMDPLDREVLSLRHFEELTNREVSQVLGITPTAASNRYVRALERLKEILSQIPDFQG
jgi:RNA polymerase sigma-70 factor (ECF subfamily)